MRLNFSRISGILNVKLTLHLYRHQQGSLMDDEQGIAIEPTYILKVIGGLAVIGAIVAASFVPGLRNWTGSDGTLMATLLIVAALVVTTLLWRIYGRLGELEKIMHHGACVLALTILALGSAVVGILQAIGLMPVFNQFWLFSAAVAVWGVCLMLVDRRLK